MPVGDCRAGAIFEGHRHRIRLQLMGLAVTARRERDVVVAVVTCVTTIGSLADEEVGDLEDHRGDQTGGWKGEDPGGDDVACDAPPDR